MPADVSKEYGVQRRLNAVGDADNPTVEPGLAIVNTVAIYCCGAHALQRGVTPMPPVSSSDSLVADVAALGDNVVAPNARASC